MNNPIALLESTIYELEPVFNRVSVDKAITFQREAEFAIQVISNNDYALKLAAANPQSVRDAVTNIAAIGISLNPAKKQAYLVPRDGKICLDLSYMGLIDLAVASGSIRWAKAELVRQADTFKLNGFDKPPQHEYQPFGERGEIVGVYVVVKTADGDYLTDTMKISDVFDIRNRTSAWKAWLEKKRKNPWVTDEGEMIKKTVIKRAYKTWPKTDRLDAAIHYLNTDGGEGLQSIDETPQKLSRLNLPELLSAIREAADNDQLTALRKQGMEAAAETQDRASAERINAAVKARRAQLNATDVTSKEPA